MGLAGYGPGQPAGFPRYHLSTLKLLARRTIGVFYLAPALSIYIFRRLMQPPDHEDNQTAGMLAPGVGRDRRPWIQLRLILGTCQNPSSKLPRNVSTQYLNPSS
jgi:hypothetical protein